MDLCLHFCFFFSSRRRHTRLVSDWSSDVCSSDLSSWARSIVALVLALGIGSIVRTARANQAKTTNREAVTVTGCLQKGDEAGEYSITSEDGKRYGLRSKAVDLSKHLGHKVTVAGTKMRE